jgi:hypothetical protein
MYENCLCIQKEKIVVDENMKKITDESFLMLKCEGTSH